MTAHRFGVALAVSLLGFAAFTGAATAQVAGCSFSSCTPEELAAPTTTTVPAEVLGEEASVAPAPAQAPAQVEAAGATAPSGSLPFTGGDVAGLAIVGAGAVGAGAVMIRRSRKTT
jgi:hypothetical protein